MELVKPATFDTGIESLSTGMVELRSSEMEVDTTVRPVRESILKHAPKLTGQRLSLRPVFPEVAKDETLHAIRLAESFGNQAVTLTELGRIDDALRLFAEARRLHEEVGNQEGLIAVLKNEALARRRMGDLVGALELFRKEAELLQQRPPA